MTADGTYTYVWDGENRLRQVYPKSPVSGSKKLVFDYDYMSRRVRKRIFLYDNGWPELTSTPDTDLKFVYDQWNVIMVLNGKASDAIQSKYTWGLDMSGLTGSGVAPGVSPVVYGIHGAGGIGGLLAWQATSMQDSPSFWYFYDGNGNVGQLVKSSDQSTAATYEYDPYGNVIVFSGTYADINPFRFSTKWFDESGLGYWGYRYYSPRLGRWMSLDPVEETGGINLFNYVNNTPVCSYDFLGTYYSSPPPGPDPRPQYTPRDAATCCRDAKSQGLDNGDEGGVICCDGQKISCAWFQHSIHNNPDVDFVVNIKIKCVTKHEQAHLPYVSCSPVYCGVHVSYRPKARYPGTTFSQEAYDASYALDECNAHFQEWKCYRDSIGDCVRAPNPTYCRRRLQTLINQTYDQMIPFCRGEI